MIAGYTDVVNEEVTPRKFKKLRVMGESDGEFTRQSTDAEEEESDADAGLVDPNELAAAKARSGGRGMTQISPASKSPAKPPPLKNEKNSSSVPMKLSKRVVQANATPKKTVRQTQPPKNAVKPNQPPKKAVKPDQPLKKAVKPDQPPKKLGRPPKNAVKQDPASGSPIAKKPTMASSGSGSAGNPVLLDKKSDTARGAPRKPKVMATAGRAPSNGSQVQAPSSETVSQKQAPNKKNTSVRIVTVAPKVPEPQANPLGDAISGKASSMAKSAPKVVQRTTPMSNAVTGKRPRPVEPSLVRDTKRSKGSTTPPSDSELTEYISANEDL